MKFWMKTFYLEILTPVTDMLGVYLQRFCTATAKFDDSMPTLLWFDKTFICSLSTNRIRSQANSITSSSFNWDCTLKLTFVPSLLSVCRCEKSTNTRNTIPCAYVEKRPKLQNPPQMHAIHVTVFALMFWIRCTTLLRIQPNKTWIKKHCVNNNRITCIASLLCCCGSGHFFLSDFTLWKWFVVDFKWRFHLHVHQTHAPNKSVQTHCKTVLTHCERKQQQQQMILFTKYCLPLLGSHLRWDDSNNWRLLH